MKPRYSYLRALSDDNDYTVWAKKNISNFIWLLMVTYVLKIYCSIYVKKSKSKQCIAVSINLAFTARGNSHAVWDHTVLPATRQRWESRLHRQLKQVLDLATPEGCVAELSWVVPVYMCVCRAFYEKALQAFVSFVQSYRKHECSRIFRFKGRNFLIKKLFLGEVECCSWVM